FAWTAKIGPYATVGEAAVGADVEGAELAGKRFGDDERAVIGRDDHTVGEGNAVGDLACRAIGRDQRDDARAEVFLAAGEGDAVQVDVAGGVDDDLVPAIVRE